eukprot:356313-Chlamydomonas_euryale.AAC.1
MPLAIAHRIRSHSAFPQFLYQTLQPSPTGVCDLQDTDCSLPSQLEVMQRHAGARDPPASGGHPRRRAGRRAANAAGPRRRRHCPWRRRRPECITRDQPGGVACVPPADGAHVAAWRASHVTSRAVLHAYRLPTALT